MRAYVGAGMSYILKLKGLVNLKSVTLTQQTT
jgi:hypothetical protein